MSSKLKRVLLSILLVLLSLLILLSLVGFILIPFLFLLSLAAVVYGIYGGIKVWNGETFRYMYVADFIEA